MMQVEKIFRQSAEFCSEHDTWKLNVAHVFFMQARYLSLSPHIYMYIYIYIYIHIYIYIYPSLPLSCSLPLSEHGLLWKLNVAHVFCMQARQPSTLNPELCDELNVAHVLWKLS